MTTPNDSEPRLSTADFAHAGTTTTAMPSDTTSVEREKETARREDDRPVEQQPMDRMPADRRDTALFPGTEAERFHSRWGEIQAGFVDEPRKSVEQADALVAEVMQRLAQVFSDERGRLEQQWDRGEDTDTEELRQALRRYRSFFDRLLAM